MGGSTFGNTGKGRNVNEVFSAIVKEAQHECGHGGYTGTIAEKGHFVLIPEPTEAQKREMLQKEVQYAQNSVATATKRLGEVKTRPESPYKANDIQRAEREVAEAQERLRAREAKLASQESIPFDSNLAHAYADFLIDKGDRRIDDKWGPAGCICIKQPEPIKEMGKAKALSLAKKKWGETAEVVVKTERASKANGGKKVVTALVYIVSDKTGWGSNEPVPGGYRRVAASASGPDEKTACGSLFASDGEWLFFGWASS